MSGRRRPGSSRVRGIERARGGCSGLFVFQRLSGFQHVAADRAIEQPRVQAGEPVVRGDALGERALARCGGAVDGDGEHALSCPARI